MSDDPDIDHEARRRPKYDTPSQNKKRRRRKKSAKLVVWMAAVLSGLTGFSILFSFAYFVIPLMRNQPPATIEESVETPETEEIDTEVPVDPNPAPD